MSDLCLVTGAAGFIGSNLVRELTNRGYHVVGFDNFETGREKNIEEVKGQFEFIEGDLREKSDIIQAIEDVDYVFHQGAVPSVPRSVDNPELTTEANCIGTTNLLVAARDEDVEKVVVASSSSVYGPSQELPKNEDMPVHPVSPYALSKYWTEQLAVQFHELYGLETVALRYFNVFGPRQNPKSDYAAVIPTFINQMLSGERPIIYGDGEQSRDFTYVDNVIEANILASKSNCAGQVLNIACNHQVTVKMLVNKLNNILGTELSPKYDDPRPGDVRHSQANIKKANRKIGYEPVVNFDKGLRQTVEFYQNK